MALPLRRRRLEVCELLVSEGGPHFSLALDIISLLRLPAVRIYASAAASLAERQRNRHLTEKLIPEIKFNLTDQDLDEVSQRGRGTCHLILCHPS